MTNATALFSPAQLDAELRYRITREDGALLGSTANWIEAMTIAGRWSITLGQPVVIGRGTFREVVDMAARWAACRELAEQIGDEHPAEAARLYAAIATGRYADACDEHHEVRAELGYFCSARGCSNELEEPMVGSYCSRECWQRDDGGL